MIVLELAGGSEKEYKTLTDLIDDNPEIEEAALMCRCPSRKTEERYEATGLTLEYDYDEIDWGWSYFGPADNLRRFARKHGEWCRENVRLKMEDGTLTGILEDYDEDEWTTDGTPQCGIRRGRTTSADRVKLAAITLPSGKRIEYRSVRKAASKTPVLHREGRSGSLGGVATLLASVTPQPPLKGGSFRQGPLTIQQYPII